MNKTSLLGSMMGLGERVITERQEQALRLVHHDLGGHTVQETAALMGITPAAVGRLLASVKKVLPQFFPVLTEQEAKCYHHLVVEDWSPSDIATNLDISIAAVYHTLERCKAKGKPFPGSSGRVLSYQPDMDNRVKTKF